MTDPQQPNVPPYASNAHQPAGYPAPAAQQPPYAPAAQPSAINTVGRIGLIVGLISLGLSLLTSTIVQVLIRSISVMNFNYSMTGVVNSIGALLAFIAALAALILGLIGLRKVGSPHAQAGIATGLGIAGVAGGVFAFMITVTAPFFY